MLMRRAQHQMGAVAIGVAAGFQRGAKWCGDRDATLGVQPVLVGAQEMGHAVSTAFPAGRLPADRQESQMESDGSELPARYPIPIEPLGRLGKCPLGWHRLAWESPPRQSNLADLLL